MEKNCDDVYKKEFRPNWYPMVSIIRFTVRYLRRRIGIDLYGVKKTSKK